MYHSIQIVLDLSITIGFFTRRGVSVCFGYLNLRRSRPIPSMVERGLTPHDGWKASDKDTFYGHRAINGSVVNWFIDCIGRKADAP